MIEVIDLNHQVFHEQDLYRWRLRDNEEIYWHTFLPSDNLKLRHEILTRESTIEIFSESPNQTRIDFLCEHFSLIFIHIPSEYSYNYLCYYYYYSSLLWSLLFYNLPEFQWMKNKLSYSQRLLSRCETMKIWEVNNFYILRCQERLPVLLGNHRRKLKFPPRWAT